MNVKSKNKEVKSGLTLKKKSAAFCVNYRRKTVKVRQNLRTVVSNTEKHNSKYTKSHKRGEHV